MKRTIASAVLLMALAFNAFSQKETNKVTKEWGPDRKVNSQSSVNELIGQDDKYIYFESSIAKSLGIAYIIGTPHIDKYSKSLEYIESVKTDLGKDLGKAVIKAYLFRDKKINLIVVDTDKKEKTKKTYLIPVDMNTLLPELSKKILLASTTFEKLRESEKIATVVSQNEQFYAVIIEQEPDDETKSSSKILMFDNENNKILETEVNEESLGATGFFIPELYQINNEGNFLVFGDKITKATRGDWYSNKRTERKEAFRIAKRQKNLIYFSKDKTESQKIPLDLEIEDVYVSQFSFETKQSGNIVCTGLYNANEEKGTKGVFYLEIDVVNNHVINRKTKEFEEAFITQFWSEREIKKAEKNKKKKDQDPVFYNYKISEILHKDNGEMVMVAEQYYVRVVTRTSRDANGNMTTTTTYYYYYNDIIVVDFKPSGEVKWMKKIPKHQISTNDGGWKSSFYAYVSGDNLHFIFNDHVENIMSRDNEIPKLFNPHNMKKGACVFLTMDNNGKMTSEILLNNKEQGTVAIPKMCQRMDDKSHMIYCDRGKKFTLLKITEK